MESETELLARVGRHVIHAEKQDEAYTALLNLLANVVSGTIARSRVLVNLTDRAWVVSDPDTTPATPGQVNGLPAFVVAPPEKAQQ